MSRSKTDSTLNLEGLDTVDIINLGWPANKLCNVANVVLHDAGILGKVESLFADLLYRIK